MDRGLRKFCGHRRRFHEFLPEAAFGLLMGSLPVLITGILYMAGGAVWRDRTQFAVGVWLSVINAVGVQELLEMTAGNLSTHLRKLEDAGYVERAKTHQGRVPATFVSLTIRGQAAFEQYTADLRALLGASPGRG